tara:strand:- start:8709 stop:9581 length:873 start_codon:yes stop_codon:yes gene_type:complete
MSIYDDFLSPRNMYSRPAQMMNNINQYMSANQAKVGANTATPTFEPTRPPTPTNTTVNFPYGDTTPIDDSPRGPDISGQSAAMLPQFVKDLGNLTEKQQELLLSFIGTSGGDMKAGLSSDEWAQFFGVSTDYADRFQGFPTLTELPSQLSGVYQRGSEAAMREVQAAQSAQIASRQRGTGVVGSRTNQLARRQLKQTLESQRERIAEQSESEYANILRQLSTTLGQGFRASAGILQEGGAEAMYDPNQQYRVGQTDIRNGQLVYWTGTDWVSEEEYMDMIQQGDKFNQYT